MTQHQVELVKNSWKLLRKVDPVLIGDVFYSKLFVDFPYVEHLFKTPREEQSKKLIAILAVVVSKLDQLEELTSDIEKLASRHVSYGVKPEHYAHVGSALLWTLERGLGGDWNEELKQAWATCYGILSSTMINAAYQKDSTKSVA
jgi:hemoglobin-like flavoprotein